MPTTPTTLPLRCACGTVRGLVKDVSPQHGNRLICMCDDCQTYAHWLDRAEAILDANGGTEVFQLTPAQLEITEGSQHIRCVRLGPKGLMRWYAGCCKTPIANSLASAKIPFVGIPHTFMDHAADGRPRDEVLGPVRARIQGRFGKAPLPEGSYARAPLGLIARSLRQLVVGALRRAHRPSPLFDAATGKPVVEPTVLSLEERNRLRSQAQARP